MASSLARQRNEGHSHRLETLIGERNYSGILRGHLNSLTSRRRSYSSARVVSVGLFLIMIRV